MKTLTKVLLLGLACANLAQAGGSWQETLENAQEFGYTTLAPQPVIGGTALSLPWLVIVAAFVKASTTALARQENNSMLVVGKNTLKSLGGSALASALLWLSNPDANGFFGAVNEYYKPNNILHRKKRGTTAVSTVLKVAALISYLAGQNNWNPVTGLKLKGIKEIFTKKYTTTEQFEFVVNTFLPLILSNWAAQDILGDEQQGVGENNDTPNTSYTPEDPFNHRTLNEFSAQGPADRVDVKLVSR